MARPLREPPAPRRPGQRDSMLSVVIPAYNEARRIPPTLERVLAYLGGRAEAAEVVVVDDGSTDGTAARVRSAAAARPEVRLVRLPRNAGKGAALRAGVAASRGRRVLVTDADLSTPIEDLPRLEDALDRGADIAVGSRSAPGAGIVRPQSPLRTWLGRGGNVLIRAVAVPGIRDTQCGFKLFDGPLGRRLFAACREDGFAIDVEALCMAGAHLGARIAEVGVRWEHRAGSKVRWIHYAQALVDVARVAARVRLAPAAAALLPAPARGSGGGWDGGLGRPLPRRRELEQET